MARVPIDPSRTCVSAEPLNRGTPPETGEPSAKKVTVPVRGFEEVTVATSETLDPTAIFGVGPDTTVVVAENPGEPPDDPPPPPQPSAKLPRQIRAAPR